MNPINPDRAILARRCRPLPIEAIVRGYLTGTSRKEFRQSGRVCGVELPAGLREAHARLVGEVK